MPSSTTQTKQKTKKQEQVEKRSKRWRRKCPKKVEDRIIRAKTEKMYVIQQTMHHEKCKFKMSGSTGNIYDVTIGKLPCCNCPDYQKREDACKHTLFVLLKIIGLDSNDELLYQRAFLSEELEWMFQKMARNSEKASKYYLLEDDDEDNLDEVIFDFSQTNLEEGGVYAYTNIRKYTGQSAHRDTSTYRPYHTERPGYGYYGRVVC